MTMIRAGTCTILDSAAGSRAAAQVAMLAGARRVLVLTAGPGRICAGLPVDVPAPRDQLTTREHPAFTRLRRQALRLIRTQPGSQDRVRHPLAPEEEP